MSFVCVKFEINDKSLIYTKNDSERRWTFTYENQMIKNSVVNVPFI